MGILAVGSLKNKKIKLVENGLFPVCFVAMKFVLKSIIAQFGI